VSRLVQMADFMSRTGSSRGVTKQNGEIIAKPHPVMKKSYAGNAAKESGNSTSKESFKDPGLKQALSAYHPNALRNRLPVEFKDSAIPAARFCYPRNKHTYDFFSGNNEAGYQRFRTTSQNYYAYDTKALAVGESNQGIVSEKSKWIHAKQTM